MTSIFTVGSIGLFGSVKFFSPCSQLGFSPRDLRRNPRSNCVRLPSQSSSSLVMISFSSSICSSERLFSQPMGIFPSKHLGLSHHLYADARTLGDLQQMIVPQHNFWGAPITLSSPFSRADKCLYFPSIIFTWASTSRASWWQIWCFVSWPLKPVWCKSSKPRLKPSLRHPCRFWFHRVRRCESWEEHRQLCVRPLLLYVPGCSSC